MPLAVRWVVIVDQVIDDGPADAYTIGPFDTVKEADDYAKAMTLGAGDVVNIAKLFKPPKED